MINEKDAKIIKFKGKVLNSIRKNIEYSNIYYFLIENEKTKEVSEYTFEISNHSTYLKLLKGETFTFKLVKLQNKYYLKSFLDKNNEETTNSSIKNMFPDNNQDYINMFIFIAIIFISIVYLLLHYSQDYISLIAFTLILFSTYKVFSYFKKIKKTIVNNNKLESKLLNELKEI